MSSFDARLRLPGRSKLPLGVEVDINHERMTVTAGDRKVGAWPLAKLEIETLSDGFHITVEGEELVLNVADSTRFASELGIVKTVRRTPNLGAYRPPRTDVSPAGQNGSPSANGQIASPSPVTAVFPDQAQLEEIQGRITEVAQALGSDSVSPAQAFGKWVRLLKELNRRHGQGSMPTDLYYRLNTQVLDLIPEPKPTPSGNDT